MGIEIKIYVANLGKYNEGELVGEWFTLPADIEEIEEAIGINEEYEEMAIHDYEAPFKIHEYDNINDLNGIAEEIDSLESYQLDDLEIILESGRFGIEEALEKLHSGDYRIYRNCDNMGDVAEQWLDETGGLHGVPDHLRNYIDFQSYGEDMETNGDFHQVGNDYIEFY